MKKTYGILVVGLLSFLGSGALALEELVKTTNSYGRLTWSADTMFTNQNELVSLFQSDLEIVVARRDTDAGNGLALLAAYTQAKALTPGGNPLSATNRAYVSLAPGVYDIGSSILILDASFVDVRALYPELGGQEISESWGGDVSDTPPTIYQPPPTIITGSNTSVVDQTVANIRLSGFGIVNETAGMPPLVVSESSGGAGSFYTSLYLYTPSYGNAAWIANQDFPGHVDGTWRDVIFAYHYAARMGYDAGATSQFRARMYNCHAGNSSFGGDWSALYGGQGQHMMTNAWLEGCSAGHASFSGCIGLGVPIAEDVTMIDCWAGRNSFGLANKIEGTFIRCRGDNSCVGSTTNPLYPGEFAGYAEDCVMGSGSFGGNYTSSCLGTNSGTIVRCSSKEGTFTASGPWLLSGATIIDSHLVNGGANANAIVLLDSSSLIIDSIIEVDESGTGIPVSALTAQSVRLEGVAFNNRDVSGNGYGPLVSSTGLKSVNAIASTVSYISEAQEQSLYISDSGSSVTNGLKLERGIDYLESISQYVTESLYGIVPMGIYLADGSYTLTGDLSIPANMKISAANIDSISARAIDTSVSRSTRHAEVIGNILFPLTSTNASLHGIKLTGDIDSSGGGTAYANTLGMEIVNCYVTGNVCSNTTLWMDIKESFVSGSVAQSSAWDTDIINTVIIGSNSFSSGRTGYHSNQVATIWKSHIAGEGCFGGSSRGGWTSIVSSKVNGDGFWIVNPTDSAVRIIDTEFFGSTGWGAISNAGNVIVDSSGILSTITNGTMAITNCTDESGATITDK